MSNNIKQINQMIDESDFTEIEKLRKLFHLEVEKLHMNMIGCTDIGFDFIIDKYYKFLIHTPEILREEIVYGFRNNLFQIQEYLNCQGGMKTIHKNENYLKYLTSNEIDKIITKS